MQSNSTSNHQLCQYLADQLYAWGVRVVFGVAGDTILTFLDCLSQHQLRFIQVRHEETAAYAASAYAKLTGELGVCLSHGGPGAVHLINGLADSKQDHCPVLALTGQVETKHIGTDYHQYINQQQLLSAVTLATENLANPGSITKVLPGLLAKAITQGGPVHLSIPKDFFAAEISPTVEKPHPYLQCPTQPQTTSLKEAASWLQNLTRPVIALGTGGEQVISSTLQLAETLGAGIIYSLPMVTKLPQHPLVVGGIGQGGAEASFKLLDEADGIIRIAETYWPEQLPREGKKVLAIDRDVFQLQRGVAGDLGLCGAVEEIIPNLITSLGEYQKNLEWETIVQSEVENWRHRLAQEAEAAGALHPVRAILALSNQIEEEAIICLDVGDHVLWFDRAFQGRGQDLLISGRWRAMGFSLGAGIAAKLAYHQRPVYVIIGDGGLSMVLGDLVSAVELGIQLVIIVFNNHSYAMESNRMQVAGLVPYGVNLRDIRFDQVARACGAVGYRIEPKDLQAALAEVQGLKSPVVMDLQIEPALIPTARL